MVFGLFARKKEAAPPPPREEPPAAAPAVAPAPSGSNGIHYSPTLLQELQGEHQQLLRVYGELGQAHSVGDLAAVARLLERLRSALNGHLLKENVRLYLYLDRALAGDADSHALVRQFRHEMDGISKSLAAFLERYKDLGSDASLAETFGADLTEVGMMLAERIQHEEETLYPLYLPSH